MIPSHWKFVGIPQAGRLLLTEQDPICGAKISWNLGLGEDDCGRYSDL